MQLAVKKFRLQRNILLILAGALTISNVALSLKVHSEQVITRLVPTITSEQIISAEYTNDEALKVRARELIWLLFSMKKENVDELSAQILKLVDNACIDDFRDQINSLSLDIKNKNYRYVFNTVGYVFDNHSFTVKVQGFLEAYMAGKQLSEDYKEYKIAFINRGGVLMLKSFEEVFESENQSK